ncbi:replication initiation protein [Enterococcus faecalis]|uniref:replication initiation protein n=1 Tax=Enterococcus faecalis TaxID=1351 RepID=UPI001B3307F8|nr:replication initiation protein [Enterococcus faecalis]MBP4090240.1 replication initiation protein [Enterococcus faecalis]
MSTKNKKASVALSELLGRQDYLVVQGNDLAKAFGGLKAFEQRVLDYCFSFVTRESKLDDVYEVTVLEIIKHFGLNTSGDSYRRIGEAFKKLNENTALYLSIIEADGTKGILMTQLFSYIKFLEDGRISFKFSVEAAPYVLDLKEKYYSFRLGELSRINGKYALIMLKLWESYRRGKEKHTTITANLDDWESWFLGKSKRISAGRFYADVLSRAVEELSDKMPIDFFVTTLKRGRKIEGYEVMITDTSIR